MSDKTGLIELASALDAAGVALVSTGGSARAIADAGLPVTPVEQVTGFPECLDGRVKTLHPAIHGGLLADTRLPAHLQQIAELGIEPFELVVVNLYPFRETVAAGRVVRRVRRADRHRRPGDDPGVGEEPPVGGRRGRPGAAIPTIETRRRGRWFHPARANGAGRGGVRAHRGLRHRGRVLPERRDVSPDDGWPEWTGATWDKVSALRYGENPHQQAALYRHWRPGLASAEQLHGKEMSYNNYVDVDAAWRAAERFRRSGGGDHQARQPLWHRGGRRWRRRDVALAHERAHACDPVSAFGGVIAVNRPVTAALAEQIAEIFTEVLLAPGVLGRGAGSADQEEEHPAAGDAGRLRAGPGGVPGDLRRSAGADAGPVDAPGR